LGGCNYKGYQHRYSAYNNIPLCRIFNKGITLKRGQALNYVDHLIELVKEENVVLDDIVTCTLPLSQVAYDYEILNNKEEYCVK